MAWVNDLGQPIGEPVGDFVPPPAPDTALRLDGRWVSIAAAVATDAPGLFAAFAQDRDGANWTYLPYGPFADLSAFSAWYMGVIQKPDPLFLTLRDTAGQIIGLASYLRIDPANGVIEVGHIHFSPLMQRTPAATEAMFLMMQWAFSHGYRRYEWKCNACNLPSRRAAMRLGLSFEGVFRQAAVVKGHNRDTAWYAAIDREWPALKAAFERWLNPSNFDSAGQQRLSLSALTAPVLVAKG